MRGRRGSRGLCGKRADPGCVPITCAQLGGRLCGRVGDGCGGALECGACPDGTPCGAQVPSVCGGGAGSCRGLCRQQVACPGGGDTTVTGTVVAPTPARFGTADPLYNVLVYVPNAPLAPFRPGVACDKCGEVSGAPLVTALTGPDGTFTLHDVPAGEDIPLVVQIGRWRRRVKIPRVAACTQTTLPVELTRLPRRQVEGDLPRMAIATGTWDPFDCTLRKIGIDEAEFTLPGGGGRVSVFAFGGDTLGPQTPQGQQLTGSREALSAFDIVLLPCDSNLAKPAAAQANLVDYTNRGGRLFLTDWGVAWLQGGPLDGVVSWKPQVLLQGPDFVGTIDQTFPKGLAFAAWLPWWAGRAGAAGRLPMPILYQGSSNVEAVVPPTQRWVYTEGEKRSIQHFTFNTPIGAPAAEQCGRVVFSQFHVAHDATPESAAPNPRLPPGLRRSPDDPAGEGARVHAVRRLVVHPARRRPAARVRGAAAGAAAAAAGNQLRPSALVDPIDERDVDSQFLVGVAAETHLLGPLDDAGVELRGADGRGGDARLAHEARLQDRERQRELALLLGDRVPVEREAVVGYPRAHAGERGRHLPRAEGLRAGAGRALLSVDGKGWGRASAAGACVTGSGAGAGGAHLRGRGRRNRRGRGGRGSSDARGWRNAGRRRRPDPRDDGASHGWRGPREIAPPPITHVAAPPATSASAAASRQLRFDAGGAA